MNEAEFHKLATVTLSRIEQAVEPCGADIDFENAGEILQLEFANRSKIIINKQGAASQIWIAAKSGGFHYTWLDGAWRSPRHDSELFGKLAEVFAEQGDNIRLP